MKNRNLKKFIGFAGVLLLALWCVPAAAQVSSVWTYHYDNLRTGSNPNETILSPSNVNASHFGKLFSQQVDGKLYAQPLYMAGVTVKGQVHNVVYAVTMHDSVYAFDADNNQGANLSPLWRVSFIGTGAGVTTTVPSSIASCTDTQPEFGILDTPVIDTSSGTIYMVDDVQVVSGGVTSYAAHLHALDISNGAEKFNGPELIKAVFGGKTFNAKQEIERPGLLLLNGLIYTTWGSHCDDQPYQGWVISYNASNLSQQLGVFCTTPNGSEGSIWESGCALGADGSGNIFGTVANGSFDANSGGQDYSNSFIRLLPGTLTVSDYFTPFNEATLSSTDQDVGTGGNILFPDSFGSTVHPHLMTGDDKTGKIYLVDRDNLGHFNASANTCVQSFANGGSGYSVPSCFSDGSHNFVFWGMVNQPLKAYAVSNGLYNTTPISKTSLTFPFPGCSPSVSSNGTANGIVWASQFGSPATLHAYDASNLSTELWNSSQAAGGRDTAAAGVKFTPPLVANGKVYYTTSTGLYVYGLLPVQTPIPSATASPTPCPSTAITPFIQVNGAAWSQVTSVTVASLPATVNLGPQPLTGGSWSWTGPNGFTSTAREVDKIPLSAGTNGFTATYTNSCGSKSTQLFTVTVQGSQMATFTFTPTSTTTFTLTMTKTASDTATKTNTPTLAFTSTPTATFTASLSNTANNTPFPTATSSSTNTSVPPTGTLTPTPTLTPVAGQVVIQAENNCGFSGTIDNNHLGFTGTGFANPTNNNTAGITFALNSAIAQTLSITFRYSDGTTTARPMLLSRVSPTVSTPVTVNFGVTTNWDTWATITVTVPLVAGNNLISLIPTGTNTNGGPNLDELTFTSSTVTVGNCGGTASALLLSGAPNTSQLTTTQVVVAPNTSRNGLPIQFQVTLGQPAEIQLSLFTVTGEKVFQTVIQGNTGKNNFDWRLEDQAGPTVASGLYVYLIRIKPENGAGQFTGKVVVVH